MDAKPSSALAADDFRRVALLWIVPALLGVAAATIVAAISPLGWWLAVVGLVLGALIGWLIVVNRERWLLSACGLSAAQPSDADDNPRLHNLLESVCLTTGVDLEATFILDRPQINLLVVGSHPNTATLLVTRGLVDSLERIEMEALTALAVGRVRDSHTVSLTTLLSTLGLASVLAESSNSVFVRLVARPMAWVTRRRLVKALGGYDDIEADCAAVRITNYPPGLIAAFERARSIGVRVEAGRTIAALWLIDPEAAGAASSGRADLLSRIAVLREL